VTAAFDRLRQALRRLPGLGTRSAERIALHLLVEQPARCAELIEALREASANIARCETCGNICEAPQNGAPAKCEICADVMRDARTVCVVESVPDLIALEKSGAYKGVYHVLHGRLSPVKGIGPAELNMQALKSRVAGGGVDELILALANDIESEATCHFIQSQITSGTPVRVSRIGFGLPSGAGLGYADATTLKSAIDARRGM
jgi:recombination protein RecR